MAGAVSGRKNSHVVFCFSSHVLNHPLSCHALLSARPPFHHLSLGNGLVSDLEQCSVPLGDHLLISMPSSSIEVWSPKH